ncbi:ATP-dependent helicase [Bythopirellula polymerisocia]|uniref:DNA 3'-5' helicase n=1 Tax=Bythopirellula polymerisocia TaxID=2528003 RepID=A0A5C6CUR9_9BACT|nr:UvrD-helicase domain-containing protein [Bythopirellula polymerisocia]TWU28168.1 ATP-dependent DNA helicase PcrA [Bythopirellula polymerisocia]
MDPLFEALNPAQCEAVRHVEGPMLVLAGPGSGKTRVVTHRIAHLLREGIPASQLLALTFTNKASAEMHQRVEELAPGERVWVSTFHRFGARLLRHYSELVGLTPNFTIYDTADAKQTLSRVIDAGRVNTLHYTPDRIAHAISDAKNKLITADKFEPRPGSPLSQIVAEVYPAYQKRLIASSAVDFDDLLLHVAQLLYQSPEVRAELDERFRYLLVDEYQDTNHVQYVMLRALSVDYPNLAVTGDPDQSIYGWRGADIKNILQFENDFPQVKVVRLEQNYRSSKRILRVADDLIQHNLRRKQKSLFTDNAEGPAVRLVEFASQDAESTGIAASIAEAIEAGQRRASDFAILYRVNALSRSLERGLREAGVPYQIIRGQEFYGRKEIKDVLAYCQLINNPRDDQAVLRTINTPTRGIGRKTVDLLSDHAYREGIPLLDAAREASSIAGIAARSAKKVAVYVALMDHLCELANGDLEEILGTVLEESGYRASLSESDSEEDLNRLANIEELLTDARQFDEQNPGGGQLETYLENAWLVNETDDWESETDKVTLMTLHAAKGLEFPVVFIIAIEHGLLPHERSTSDEAQLEEERRLAFVGITRAKEELQLSYAIERDFRGQRRHTVPSSFLMEIPRDALELVTSSPDMENWHDESWLDEEQEYAEEDQSDEFADVSFDFGAAAEPKAESPAEKSADWPTVAGQITTAAALAGVVQDSEPRVSPDAFAQGMTVVHPKHGVGKIVALSGSGKNRRATVRFVTVGEKRFILAYSPLRPAGK